MARKFLFLLLFCAAPIWAQQQRVSGTISGPEGRIAHVSVREIDADHRIFSHTSADGNGLFTFLVRDVWHSLQFYAPGYRTLTHKMNGMKSFRVTLERRRTSPYAATAKLLLRSNSLICGRYQGQSVRCTAWIERMSDSLYAIVLPVEMERAVDEYAAGRTMALLDATGQQVMLCENVVDAYPLAGDPDEVDQIRIAQSYAGIVHSPGVSGEGERLYAYPHFQITRSQLEQICREPARFDRMVVDTYRADNYWNFFPTPRTADVIRKALQKDTH